MEETEALFDLPAPLAVQRLGRHLQGVPDGPPRRLYLGRRLKAAPVLPLVRLLACAQREAALGNPDARVLFDLFGSLVSAKELEEEMLGSLTEGAEQLFEFGLLGVLNGERAEEVAPDWVPKIIPRGSLAATGETLGRRKTLGRTATGDTLDRLLIDPHPEVIKNVLLNPRIKEAHVVRLASRAQASGAILQVVADSKWRSRAQVRRAVVGNPKCPPGLACELLASLTRAELLEVAHDSRMHEDVRAAARALLEAKPPRLPQ